jgi:hypothetical protein
LSNGGNRAGARMAERAANIEALKGSSARQKLTFAEGVTL